MRRDMAEGGSPGRFTGRIVGWVIGWVASVVWVVLVLLGSLAWVWTGRLHRTEASSAFDERTRVAAAFTADYLDGTLARGRQDAARMLAGPTVGQQQLAFFSATSGFALTGVFDGQAHVLRSWPPAPALIGSSTNVSRFVRPALRHGKPLVSDVYISTRLQEPVVTLVMPYRTPYGPRAFTGAFVPARSPLGVYLRDAVAPARGHAYYVDRAGNLAASSDPLPSKVTPLAGQAPGLARALGRRPSGSYRQAGRTRRYSSADVGGTGWRLVTEVPRRLLYARVDQTQRRIAVVLLTGALFSLAATVTIALDARQRRRTERRLRALNAQYARQASELLASNTELESFSYTVAHDLRAPLRAMTGYAEILLEGHAIDDPADETVRLLTRIRGNAVTMAELIDALLSFSRLQRQVVRTRTVDLTALTARAWDALAGHRADRDMRFDLADLPPCQGDADLLMQLLTNLLDNAIKFTRDRPDAHVEVGSRPGPEGFATYFVKDNGAGFDPDHADHLFEPFQRLHAPGAYEGLGIGLSLSRRIVTRHGGRITAESTPGQGAVFTFTLPTR